MREFGEDLCDVKGERKGAANEHFLEDAAEGQGGDAVAQASP